MEGCSAPLVVKFADTQREKEQKKIQQMQASILNITSNGITPTLGQNAQTLAAVSPTPTTTASATTLLSNPSHQQGNHFIAAGDSISPTSLQLLQQLQAVGLQQHLIQGNTKLLSFLLLFFFF